MPKVIYSCVVDAAPRFAREAWSLGHSLVKFCDASPEDIHIQLVPEVDPEIATAFAVEGWRVHRIERFGDGTFCNKIAQLQGLRESDFDVAVLLDTDTIAAGDLRPFLSLQAVRGKIVDGPNPPLQVLLEVFNEAGLTPPDQVPCDKGGMTLRGNCNGGLYAIPRGWCEPISSEWRRWAVWLLEDATALKRHGRARNTDQVAFCLALQALNAPFECAPSNANYYVHMDGAHGYFDDEHEIALLHYHEVSATASGLLAPPTQLEAEAQRALQRANDFIANELPRLDARAAAFEAT